VPGGGTAKDVSSTIAFRVTFCPISLGDGETVSLVFVDTWLIAGPTDSPITTNATTKHTKLRAELDILH
jgi:hypothetical protein